VRLDENIFWIFDTLGLLPSDVKIDQRGFGNMRVEELLPVKILTMLDQDQDTFEWFNGLLDDIDSVMEQLVEDVLAKEQAQDILYEMQNQQIHNIGNSPLGWSRLLKSLTHDSGLGLASRYYHGPCEECNKAFWLCRCGLQDPEKLRRIQNWHRAPLLPEDEEKRRIETQLALQPRLEEESKVEEFKEEDKLDDNGDPGTLQGQQVILEDRVFRLENILGIHEDTFSAMDKLIDPRLDDFQQVWPWAEDDLDLSNWILTLWWWRRLQRWIMSRHLAIMGLNEAHSLLNHALFHPSGGARPWIILLGEWCGGFHVHPFNQGIHLGLARMRFELLILVKLLKQQDLYDPLEGVLLLMSKSPKEAAGDVKQAKKERQDRLRSRNSAHLLHPDSLVNSSSRLEYFPPWMERRARSASPQLRN